MCDIAGRPMIARVVERSRRACTLQQVVVATTTLRTERPLIEACGRLQVPVYCGSEGDVLERYLEAARFFAADVVVRLTADCPLIDPEVVDVVVARYLDARPDYASNTLHRSWPRGLDTEAFSAAVLEAAALEAVEPHEREHVTPYVYRHPERFCLLPVVGLHAYGDLRWTVDTREDLAMVREVYHALDGRADFGWRDVLQLVQKRPEIAELNCSVLQKDLESR